MKKKYKYLLKQYYEEDNKEIIQNIENKLYQKYGTNKVCPRCKKQLLVSDLKQYKYLCIYCDENFFEIEVLNR